MIQSRLKNASRTLIAVIAIAFAATACSDDDPVQVQANDLVATAQSAGSFNTLLTALEAAGLTETVATGGPFTVFAPTDAAFDALPAGVLDGLLTDTDALKEVLLYHVAQGELMAADLDGASSITTLQGQKIAVTTGSILLNEIMVDQADILAGNGVIHVIGQVLLPPSMTIAETASDNASFSTLAAALEATGLDEALGSNGPFTVFAPTNDAFAGLPEGALEGLLANIPELTDVLLYHVVGGNVFAGDLDGLASTPTLLEGKSVFIDLTSGVKINDATVVIKDIIATNGVIHVIDQVLLPN